ncbi:uncharacterized protein LOC126795505 [Argentina anserina]|uniref:uncharacterized protein LOC126795505 n=1 Tax=Argentina anserina TaxID=57926 RepID=UPI0021765C76|nr:uncharacterized protein LOC126795505 [Potentilla anserina]
MNKLRKLLKKEEEDSITRNRQRAMQAAASEIQRIQEEESQWGGSREGRWFEGDIFRRRYRMRPHLFDQMMNGVANYDPYFVQTRDASGRVGLSTEHKLTCAMKMLAYGLPGDLCDEFLDVAESSIMEILQHFTRAI